MLAIVAKKLRVQKGRTLILKDISLEVTAGQLTGLIGPSGSGKTTLLRSIVGAQQIMGGSLMINNLPAGNKSLRSQIGYVTQSPAVYEDITVRQNLAYFAAIVKADKSSIARVLKEVDLQKQATQIVSSLSGGERARVSLAIALLGNASVLILDEPTVGLDPLLRRNLWQLFQKLADDGRTLLVSSHVMDEAERCADLLLLREGKVLYQGTKTNLLAQTKTPSVEKAFLQLIEGRN